MWLSGWSPHYKRWLHRFRNRSELKNKNYWWGWVCWWRSYCHIPDSVGTSGERIPKAQVFSGNETGLFWKEDAQEKLHSWKCKEAYQGIKHEDRWTLALCGNTAGHVKAQSNKSSVQGQRTHSLSKTVRKQGWQSPHLLDGFLLMFHPTSEKIFAEERLEFKVLLIMDNA